MIAGWMTRRALVVEKLNEEWFARDCQIESDRTNKFCNYLLLENSQKYFCLLLCWACRYFLIFLVWLFLFLLRLATKTGVSRNSDSQPVLIKRLIFLRSLWMRTFALYWAPANSLQDQVYITYPHCVSKKHDSQKCSRIAQMNLHNISFPNMYDQNFGQPLGYIRQS